MTGAGEHFDRTCATAQKLNALKMSRFLLKHKNVIKLLYNFRDRATSLVFNY